MRKPTSLIVGIIFTLFSVQASADFCEYRCWDYNGDSVGNYSSVFSSSDGLDHDLFAPGAGPNLFQVSNYTNLGNALFVPADKTDILLPFSVYRPIIYARNQGGGDFTVQAWNSSGKVGEKTVSAGTNIPFPSAICVDDPIDFFRIIHTDAEPLLIQICYLEEPSCE